jgi:hypothetical protein
MLLNIRLIHNIDDISKNIKTAPDLALKSVKRMKVNYPIEYAKTILERLLFPLCFSLSSISITSLADDEQMAPCFEHLEEYLSIEQ